MHIAHHADLPQHYLKPGELCCTDRSVVVTTVLGSCVSATFFHRISGLAAICHVLHPQCPQPGACPDRCDAMHRYAPCAISAMAHWMAKRGVRPGQIEVKLFGGAAMMGQRSGRIQPPSIGRLNAQAALETLQRLGMTLKVADVGGTTGRKILFDTATGEVWLKRLPPAMVANGMET
jgi:chemotaxis protein CheD